MTNKKKKLYPITFHVSDTELPGINDKVDIVQGAATLTIRLRCGADDCKNIRNIEIKDLSYRMITWGCQCGAINRIYRGEEKQNG